MFPLSECRPGVPEKRTFFGDIRLMKFTSDCIRERNAFEEKLTDFLSEFSAEKDLHPAETVLAVHVRSRELRVGVPAEFSRAWECYELASFFREENGEIVPDCDAVADLSASFFFIR